jgi:hypothetical protein
MQPAPQGFRAHLPRLLGQYEKGCLKSIFCGVGVGQLMTTDPSHQRAVPPDQHGEGLLILGGDKPLQQLVVRGPGR